MHNIVKNVINAGGYDLTTILEKIDTFWAEGRLTDNQRQELKDLARAGATAQTGVDLFAKLQELEARVKALEETQSTDSTEASADDYKVGHWYYKGDKCLWNGVTYTCTAPDGVVCVWSPEEYPTYWTKEE